MIITPFHLGLPAHALYGALAVFLSAPAWNLRVLTGGAAARSTVLSVENLSSDALLVPALCAERVVKWGAYREKETHQERAKNRPSGLSAFVSSGPLSLKEARLVTEVP